MLWYIFNKTLLNCILLSTVTLDAEPGDDDDADLAMVMMMLTWRW
jgi:hypothetical protein